MKGKKEFIFNENIDTYTVTVKKKNYWWLLFLLLPFLLLILQLKFHKTVLIETIDNNTNIVLSDANVDFLYIERDFIDIKKFQFLTKNEKNQTKITDNKGIASFEVSYTLYTKLFHSTDITTIVATGGCFQSDTVNPLFFELNDNEKYTLKLVARKQLLYFDIIDSIDRQALPNADVKFSYYIGGQEQSQDYKSDASGKIETKILYCADSIKIEATHYGYNSVIKYGNQSKFKVPENRTLALSPILTSIQFIVKDLVTKRPVSGASVSLVFANNTQSTITNTDGIGKGMFDSVAIVKKMQIKVSHPAYYDTLTASYTAEDYIKLSEQDRTIYIRPKPGNYMFKNIDKFSKEAIAGVKNEVFVNGNKIGEYFSNSNGEFSVPDLSATDKISIISSKENYETNNTTVNNTQVSKLSKTGTTKIPLEPHLQPQNVKPPTSNCRVHFSGTLLSDTYIESHISLIYKPDKYGEYVGEGEYPSNAIAFPHAVEKTFDAIAVAKGTRVILYKKPNYQGGVVLDVTGPALINNVKWKNDSRIGGFKNKTFKSPFETMFPKSSRSWSSEDMNKWSHGSVKVICN